MWKHYLLKSDENMKCFTITIQMHWYGSIATALMCKNNGFLPFKESNYVSKVILKGLCQKSCSTSHRVNLPKLKLS